MSAFGFLSRYTEYILAGLLFFSIFFNYFQSKKATKLERDLHIEQKKVAGIEKQYVNKLGQQVTEFSSFVAKNNKELKELTSKVDSYKQLTDAWQAQTGVKLKNIVVGVRANTQATGVVKGSASDTVIIEKNVSLPAQKLHFKDSIWFEATVLTAPGEAPKIDYSYHDTYDLLVVKTPDKTKPWLTRWLHKKVYKGIITLGNPNNKVKKVESVIKIKKA